MDAAHVSIWLPRFTASSNVENGLEYEERSNLNDLLDRPSPTGNMSPYDGESGRRRMPRSLRKYHGFVLYILQENINSGVH